MGAHCCRCSTSQPQPPEDEEDKELKPRLGKDAVSISAVNDKHPGVELVRLVGRRILNQLTSMVQST